MSASKSKMDAVLERMLANQLNGANGAFLKKHAAKYAQKAAARERMILRGLNPIAIRSNSEISDIMKLSAVREKRIRRGHNFMDVMEEETIIQKSLAPSDTTSPNNLRRGSTESANIGLSSTRSRFHDDNEKMMSESGVEEVLPTNINLTNQATNYMKSAATSSNISTLVNFDTTAPIYYGITLLVMNYIGEVLYVSSNNELRCKPLNLLQATDRVKFKIIDVKHANKSGAVHYGDPFWLQILENAEFGDGGRDSNSFKNGLLLAAKVQNLPKHDVATLSGAVSTSNTAAKNRKNKSMMPSVSTATDASEHEPSSVGGDLCGHIDIIRIADVRKLENTMLDFNEKDDYDNTKHKRSYVSKQANFIGRWCIHSAIRDEDLTETQKADRMTKTSDNHTEQDVVCSLTPVVIQQDFYCLSTMPSSEFTYWPKESDDIVANTSIFSPDEMADFDRWRKSNSDYALVENRKKNAQKRRGKPRTSVEKIDDDDDMEKKVESLEEKLNHVDFGCLRSVVARKFPYEYAVDRKCVWKFLLFEQFASKDGETTDGDKIVHVTMETANMVLKLSKANREGGNTYMRARAADTGDDGSPTKGTALKYSARHTNDVLMKGFLSTTISSATNGQQNTPNPLTSKGGSSSESMRSSGKTTITGRDSMMSANSKCSALPALKSGETFSKTIRLISRINVADIQEKYTEISRNNELNLDAYFKEKREKMLRIETGEQHILSTTNSKMSNKTEGIMGKATGNANASISSTIDSGSSTKYQYNNAVNGGGIVMMGDGGMEACTGVVKPSRLMNDNDEGEFTDVHSTLSGMSSTVQTASSYHYPLSRASSVTWQQQQEEQQQQQPHQYVDGVGSDTNHSVHTFVTSYKPSQAIQETFKMNEQRRLEMDDLLLDQEVSIKNFDKLSKGEQVLALHTTFHHVMRQQAEELQHPTVVEEDAKHQRNHRRSLDRDGTHHGGEHKADHHHPQNHHQQQHNHHRSGTGLSLSSYKGERERGSSFPKSQTPQSCTSMSSSTAAKVAPGHHSPGNKAPPPAWLTDKISKLKGMEAEVDIVLNYHERIRTEIAAKQDADATMNYIGKDGDDEIMSKMSVPKGSKLQRSTSAIK